MCPYYETSMKYCNFYSNYQDQNQRDSYCLSGSNWRNCANYTNRSFDEKVSKKLRSNPDL